MDKRQHSQGPLSTYCHAYQKMNTVSVTVTLALHVTILYESFPSFFHRRKRELTLVRTSISHPMQFSFIVGMMEHYERSASREGKPVAYINS